MRKTFKIGQYVAVIFLFATAIVACSKDDKTANVPVTGVTLNKTSLHLISGDSEKLIATVLPENATDKTVTWVSSDPEVVTVDQNGNVTAKDWGGESIIMVITNDGKKTASCKITTGHGIP